MSKIKITTEQAKMLQQITSNKVVRISEEQFKLIESELNTIPKSSRPSIKVAKAFKKAGITAEEESLLGHPVAGSGGDEYNPQSEEENEKTTKSFNESTITEDISNLPEYSEIVQNTLEYIKGLYNNESQQGLSTFWVKNGFTHGDLNKILTMAGIIIGGVYGGDKIYRLSKKLAPAKMIKKGASAILSVMKQKKQEEPKNVMKKRVPTVTGPNKPKDPNDPRYSKVAETRKKPKPQQLPNPELGKPKSKRDMQPKPLKLDNPELSEAGDYPMGAANDPRAPYNQDGQVSTPMQPKISKFNALYTNDEISILADVETGKKYIFYFDHLSKEDFRDYAEVAYTTSKGEDGDVDYDYDYDSFEIDGDVTEKYVNDNLKHLKFGVGIEGYNDGDDVVLIDKELALDIIDTWSADENLKKVLGLQESTTSGSSGAFVAPIGTKVIKRDIKEGDAPKISMFSDEEGAEMKTMDEVTEEVEEIEEETTTASVGGSYVTPKMWAKSKADHQPSKKTMYPKGKFVSESNQTDTAYPDGKFVEFDDCTKLNNNKKAQEGGCSTGAVDGVAKEKSSKNSVISKEALYYEIAKKTGKTEKEVQSIIEGYLLNKAK